MKLNNFTNIFVTVLCGLVLSASAFLAYKKPWVTQYQDSMNHYYTGFGINQPPVAPTSLNNPKDRVSGYVYFLHQSTVPDVAIVNVDLQCMKKFSGSDDHTFNLALDFIDTYYNYSSEGNLKLQVSDFQKRIDLIFGTDFSARHVLKRGGQMENQIALTKLEGMVAEKASVLNKSEFINEMRSCYSKK